MDLKLKDIFEAVYTFDFFERQLQMHIHLLNEKEVKY